MNCGGANDCCAVGAVPGGKYDRSDDPQYAATVSAFKLDVYEVTLGRFRTFVNAGKGTQASPPAANDGAHPKIANSGWQTAFNASLETDTATLKAALSCDPQAPVWTDTPGANENKPINCVTWYEALAFCAWDGGRLPTEAEWNFAASGGADQRAYPWGADINQSKAAYDCGGKGQGKCVFGDLLNVGSKSPAGDGKYGQADLGGNVWEYVLDYFVEPYAQKTCNDCADLTPSANRGFRGGGYGNDGYYLHSLVRLGDTPLQRDYDVGIRCARD